MVDILQDNCRDTKAKMGFNEVACSVGTSGSSLSLPLCYFMLLALVPLEIETVTKLSVQLRLIL